jgi:hypothetical protein
MTERLRMALRAMRDYGYQPMYNGRPSCPFCGNFVDDEEGHNRGCVLLTDLEPSEDCSCGDVRFERIHPHADCCEENSA